MIASQKVYRRSLTYGIVLICVSIILILIGLVSLWRGEKLIGYFMPLIGLMLLAAAFAGLKDNQPRVIIDEEGITAREWGDGLKILWTDIRDMKVIAMPRIGSSVNLELYDEEKYLQQLSEHERVSRKNNDKYYGQTAFNFLTTALDDPKGDIYQEIREHILLANNSKLQ